MKIEDDQEARIKAELRRSLSNDYHSPLKEELTQYSKFNK
jgi:hypothetical protein